MLYINDNLKTIDTVAALGMVSAQRREKALRFRHEQGRRECLAAYLLLMDALHREHSIIEPPVFEYSEGGKPCIVGHPDIHFNLSHCREAAVCILSDAPVGIDVETIRPFKDSLAKHVLSYDEYQDVVASAHQDIEFIKLWTRKEAILKLTGEGIRSDLKTVIPQHPDISFSTVVTDRYVYTVCRYG